MSGEWAHLSLTRDSEQKRAEAAFKKAHPGADFTTVGNFRVGYVPYIVDGEECSITMKGDTWRVVLDGLGKYFSEDQPDTG